MRKVILNVAISLDGLIEGPNGEYDWCLDDQDYGMTPFMDRIGTILIGRKSYEVLEAAMPDAFPDHEMVLVSTTLQASKPGVRIVSQNLKEEVEALKRAPGKDIWLFGGEQLTTTLFELGLVDELLLAVHPLALGKGKGMFEGLNERLHLQLLNHKVYSSGLVQLHYAVRPQGPQS